MVLERLNNLKIRDKLLLLLAIPSIALFFFASVTIIDKNSQYRTAHTNQQLHRLAESLSIVVDDFQKERDLSAGFRGSQGRQFMPELLSQRQLTDQNLQRTNLAKKLELIANQLPQFFEQSTTIMKKLQQHQSERSANDNLNTPYNPFGYYSEINAKIIDLIQKLEREKVMKNSQLTGQNRAFGILLWLQEYAGLERDYLNHQLISGEVEPSELKEITGHITQQERLIADLGGIDLSPYIKQKLSNIETDKTSQNINQMRDIVLTQGKNIDAKRWYQQTTLRINNYYTLSRQIGKNITLQAEQEADKTLFTLIFYSLLILLVLLATILFDLLISKRLAAGITAITKTLKRIEESGEFNVHPVIYGNDEIAVMVRSFNAIMAERQADEKKLQLAARVFDNTTEGIIITSPSQIIVAANRAVSEMTGYRADELIGETPRLLSSGRHDALFYKQMWKSIKSEGYWLGEIWNRRKDGQVYPEWQNICEVRDRKGELINYIAVFSDISIIKHSQERMEYLAHHDPLTNLPNRLLFEKRMQRALARAERHHQSLALMFLDLDHFKKINDSLGHPAGDALLCAVTKRLKKLVRTQDTIARLGGDEFAIVLEEVGNIRDIAQIAEKIIHTLVQPFTIEKSEIFTSTSIGISLYPGDGLNADVLVKNADFAMYHAKDRGRNNFQFYGREMTEAAIERLSIEHDLRRALSHNELILHYQPQFSLSTGDLIGVEALMHWITPDKRLIPADKFIPVAEESRLIDQIDAWAVHEACTQARLWQEKNLKPITVAVNLSGFNIEHGNFMSTINSALLTSGLAPQWLELEVSEGYFMRYKEQAAEFFTKLRERGVALAIDDFGTGYSSLSYLKSLSLGKLKIDRSFVSDLTDDDKRIVQAIVAMGHSFNLQVIAEGVESKAQEKILKTIGCDIAQGYLYARPMPADEVETFMVSY